MSVLRSSLLTPVRPYVATGGRKNAIRYPMMMAIMGRFDLARRGEARRYAGPDRCARALEGP